MPISCDTAGHGKGCKTVSSSFRCLAVYTILAMYPSLKEKKHWINLIEILGIFLLRYTEQLSHMEFYIHNISEIIRQIVFDLDLFYTSRRFALFPSTHLIDSVYKN